MFLLTHTRGPSPNLTSGTRKIPDLFKYLMLGLLTHRLQAHGYRSWVIYLCLHVDYNLLQSLLLGILYKTSLYILRVVIAVGDRRQKVHTYFINHFSKGGTMDCGLVPIATSTQTLASTRFYYFVVFTVFNRPLGPPVVIVHKCVCVYALSSAGTLSCRKSSVWGW